MSFAATAVRTLKLHGTKTWGHASGIDSDVDVLLFCETPDIAEQTSELATNIRVWSGNDGHIHVFDLERWSRLAEFEEPIVDNVRRDLVVLSGDPGRIGQAVPT